MAKKLELGLIVHLDDKIEQRIADIRGMGMTTCQLNCWQPHILTRDLAKLVVEASKRQRVRVSSVWAGHSGKTVWNFLQGPLTIGLIPVQTRSQRVKELCQGVDFASWIGAPSITTHIGFIHENPNYSDYMPFIKAVRQVALHCKKRGIRLDFETGEETPVTLLRCIEDVGTDNLGVNLDPANFILYGKANPVDALDVIGPYVQGVHAKDGIYPTTGRELGKETPLGKGKVDFPAFMAKLKKLKYRGPITIEREISGPKQVRDIKQAIKLLEPLL